MFIIIKWKPSEPLAIQVAAQRRFITRTEAETVQEDLWVANPVYCYSIVEQP